MAQKVFILENFTSSNVATASALIINYWGSVDKSIKFIAHKSYLTRLITPTGYFAVKVTRINSPENVNLQWISFDINDVANIEAGSSSARYFVIKKEALDKLLIIDPNANSIGIEIGVTTINNKKVHSIIIGPGTFRYIGGGGTGSPTAGAKLP